MEKSLVYGKESLLWKRVWFTETYGVCMEKSLVLGKESRL